MGTKNPEKIEGARQAFEKYLKKIIKLHNINLKILMKYYGTFEAQAHGKSEGVLVKMTCFMADFEGEIEASSEIQEIRWLDYSNLDIISPVDKLIFKDLYNKKLIK